MIRLMHQRKAASVFPVPVGARMRVDSPRAMDGQPIICGVVGAGNTASNHSRTAGWNIPRPCSADVAFTSCSLFVKSDPCTVVLIIGCIRSIIGIGRQAIIEEASCDRAENTRQTRGMEGLARS